MTVESLSEKYQLQNIKMSSVPRSHAPSPQPKIWRCALVLWQSFKVVVTLSSMRGQYCPSSVILWNDLLGHKFIPWNPPLIRRSHVTISLTSQLRDLGEIFLVTTFTVQERRAKLCIKAIVNLRSGVQRPNKSVNYIACRLPSNLNILLGRWNVFAESIIMDSTN